MIATFESIITIITTVLITSLHEYNSEHQTFFSRRSRHAEKTTSVRESTKSLFEYERTNSPSRLHEFLAAATTSPVTRKFCLPKFKDSVDSIDFLSADADTQCAELMKFISAGNFLPAQPTAGHDIVRGNCINCG